MKKFILLTLGTAFLMTSCAGVAAAKSPPTQTKTHLPPPVTDTPQPTPTAAETSSPIPSP
ncbi:MAG: hypothetical protein HRF47_13670 [Chloroflexota bacterium]